MSSAHAERRIALAIGNGAYKTVANLPNPSGDAAAIGNMFRAAGFDEVTVKTDLSITEMRAELRDFARKTSEADIAVVFYAGHGIEVGGHNYLVPVDALLEYDTDVEDEAVDVDRILQQLEPAKRLKLVILDACRENPFAPRMRSLGRSRDIGRGLVPSSRQGSDTLIAYAAAVGATAADGSGKHSPFTSALLDNLTTPGLDVRIALGLVHDEVLHATGRAQEPFVYGALGGGTLALTPKTSPADAPAPADARQADFDSAMQLDTPTALDAFLTKYPSGALAGIARRERDRLTKLAAITPQPIVTPTPEPTTPSPTNGKPALAGAYGDWKVYIDRAPEGRFCYALSAPKERSPDTVKRDAGYAFISTRPSEKVKNEVSFILGFRVNAGSAAIDGEGFEMLPKGSFLWPKTLDLEKKFVESARNGLKVDVRATTAQGVVVTDSYSLVGLAQALDRVAKECQ